jgi:chromosome segregation ATPase
MAIRKHKRSQRSEPADCPRPPRMTPTQIAVSKAIHDVLDNRSELEKVATEVRATQIELSQCDAEVEHLTELLTRRTEARTELKSRLAVLRTRLTTLSAPSV